MTVIPPGYKSWLRVEPDARRLTLAEGARARLADPLFMLGQQWRAGEFRHETGAVPILAEIETASARLDAVRGASEQIERFAKTPHAGETLAEPPATAREAANARAGVRLGRSADRAMQAGDAAGVAAWSNIRAGFVAAPDGPDRFARLRAKGGGAPLDGRRLMAAIEARDRTLTAGPLWARLSAWAIAEGGHIRRRPILERPPLPDFFDGFDSDVRPGDIFSDGSFSHFDWAPGGFSLDDLIPLDLVHDRPEVNAAPIEAETFEPDELAHRGSLYFGEAVFSLIGEVGDVPGWTHLDAEHVVVSGNSRHIRAIPTRLSFPGKPPERFWSLSEAATDWDAVTAGPSELGRMVAGAILAEGSADWFILPVGAPRNALVEIRNLQLLTGFDRRGHAPHPAGQAGLVLWQSVRDRPADALVTVSEAPPVAGPPIERAVLKPEDATNMLWLIERRLPDADGRGRLTTDVRDAPASGERDGEPAPLYHLQVDPPRGWYPFRQVPGEGFRKTGFAVSAAGRQGAEGKFGATIASVAFGRVPTRGLALERRAHMGRDPSGAPRMWISRCVSVATDEIALSGLGYDRLVLPSEH